MKRAATIIVAIAMSISMMQAGALAASKEARAIERNGEVFFYNLNTLGPK